MGGACGTYGAKRERDIRHFDGKMLKKHHFDDLGKYGRIILKQDLQGVV
jgi:hypothetical protein